MSQIEDRLLEHEQEHLNPYEKLRKLQARREQHKQMQEQHVAKEHATVEEVSDSKTDSLAAKLTSSKVKLQLKPKFKWAQSDSGEYEISPELSQDIVTVEPKTIKSTDRIMNFLGYEIDLAGKIDFFKASYQKAFIESKSHNFLMAKFSELKTGAFHMILSALGVETDHLKNLQKEALVAAIEETILLYEQNVYNLEVFQLFSTGIEDQAKLKLFEESRVQLTFKMDRYGQKDFFSDEKVNSFQQKAVRQILQDLLEEKQNMEYQREFV